MEVQVLSDCQEDYHDLTYKDDTILVADFVTHFCFRVIKKCIGMASYINNLIDPKRQKQDCTCKETQYFVKLLGENVIKGGFLNGKSTNHDEYKGKLEQIRARATISCFPIGGDLNQHYQINIGEQDVSCLDSFYTHLELVYKIKSVQQALYIEKQTIFLSYCFVYNFYLQSKLLLVFQPTILI